MFLTVLIESHAEPSLCMQMHTLLSSISAGGGGGGAGRAGAAALVHELGDGSVLAARSDHLIHTR